MDATTPPDVLDGSYEILPADLQQFMTDLVPSSNSPSGPADAALVVFEMPKGRDGAPGLLSVAELLNRPPPSWLVQDVMRPGELVFLYGKPGSGKTFVALDLAMSVVTGTSWFGRPVRQGPVVYVAGEGLSGLVQRIPAWDERCIQNPRDAPWTELFVSDGAVQFVGEQFDGFLASLASLPRQPALVVVDTLARATVAADENSARDMGMFVAACDQLRSATGATVLVIHHTSKEGASERGSSALRGAADTMIEVSEASGSSRHQKLIQISCDKQKEAAEFEPLTLELRTVTVSLGGTNGPVTSCKLGPTEDGTNPPRSHVDLGPVGLTICRALRDQFFEEGAPHGELREASGVPKSSFGRSLKAAVSKGYIERFEQRGRPRYRLTSKFNEPEVPLVPPSPNDPNGHLGLGPKHFPPLRGGKAGTDPGTDQLGGQRV